MRVHELAKELGVASKELLATLEEMGVGRPVGLLERARGPGAAAPGVGRQGDPTAPKTTEASSRRRSPQAEARSEATPKAVLDARTPSRRRHPEPAPAPSRRGRAGRPRAAPRRSADAVRRRAEPPDPPGPSLPV